MGDDKTLPRLPVNRWWGLRHQFHNTLPKNPVDAKYLATVFGIAEPSAKTYLSMISALGLLDDDNKPTELANKWRLDATYVEACTSIMEDVYPQGLRDVAPGPVVDTDKAAAWIASNYSMGMPSARHVTSLYAVIAEGDLNKAPDLSSNVKAKQLPKTVKPPKSTPQATPAHSKQVPQSPELIGELAATHSKSSPEHMITPTVHLDVQIHISPDASNEQIEKIFSSMGKYIFNRKADS